MRDFFQRQDTARRLSGRLALVLAATALGTVLATAAVLAGLATLLALLQFVATTRFEVSTEYWVAAFTSRFVLAAVLAGVLLIGGIVQRTRRVIECGGTELAQQLGGTRVLTIGCEPRYKPLSNIVEELAIVTGAPAPKIFVLEDEDGINAFAAGLAPKDTVVGVTRGALEYLDRSQLQAVLAHEFSHIVNRDVRINVQTLGALQGIEAVASIARHFRRMGISSGINGSMLATAFGMVLWPVGQIGVLFGSLARMALNRQREFLADAAAVQFTRNPEGLSSALKLIAAHALQGQIKADAAHTASHFFFAEGTSPLGSLLRSHPPIEMRIRRLEPDWDEVLPIVLPAHAARMEPSDSDHVDDNLVVAGEPLMPTASVREPAAGMQPLPRVQIPAAHAFEADEYEAAADEEVSEADKRAFLETLASVRAADSHENYNTKITHWPTLVATAAAAIGGSLVFSWLTSR